MRAAASGKTDVGRQREHNEDSYAILGECDLFVVADGMGGHRAGNVASQTATEALLDFFRSTVGEDVTWPFNFDTALSEEQNRLITGIRVANRKIFERSIRSRDLHGMGTTIVAAHFSAKKNEMVFAHVGDSRFYRVRGGALHQLTRDHSLLNEYEIAMPQMTEQEKAEVPRNVITRALGMSEMVDIDLGVDVAQLGDVYLLCSDGLSGMLSDAEILELMGAHEAPSDTAAALVAKANDNGGDDNITAVVIRILES